MYRNRHSMVLLLVLGILALQSCSSADERFPRYHKQFENLAKAVNKQNAVAQEQTLRTELFHELIGLSESSLRTFEETLFADTVSKYNISDACLRDTKQVLLAITNKEQWALRMLDAMGKPSSDILNGNVMWLGSYDECNAVEAMVYTDLVNSTGPMYKLNGKYCASEMPLGGTLGLKVYVGFCVPKVCSTNDATALLNTVLSLVSNKFQVYGSSCPEVETEYDDRAIVSLVICSIIGVLMLLGTAYDVIYVRYLRVKQQKEDKEIKGKTDVEQCQSESSLNESTSLLKKLNIKPKIIQREDDGIPGKVLMAFSVISNGEKILNTSQGESTLTALNGMRFLSISWVILGHTYSSALQFSVNMMPFFEKNINRWTFQAIGNAFVSVDSFFAMSGLLLSYLFIKEMKKNGKMNWPMFYFHRFWRLTPIYMLVLMIDTSLTRYMGGDGGPIWPKDGIEKNFCEDTWWTNLLYINNLVKTDTMCMGWSWYLSNDMQFFIISPLMLIPLYYSKFIGLAVCGVILLASFITTGVLSTHHGWPATVLGNINDPGALASYMSDYYMKPWCRIGPYIVGIMAGYILASCNGRVKINKWVNLLCWAVAATVACLVLYGLYGSLTGTPLSTSVAAFYNAVHRSAWGACVCWVICACATGNGGFVNTLLSWKALIPLSRLSYSAYLVHLVFITINGLVMHYPVYLSVHGEVINFLGMLVISFGIAFIASLAFESPMMGLEKVLFPRRRK